MTSLSGRIIALFWIASFLIIKDSILAAESSSSAVHNIDFSVSKLLKQHVVNAHSSSNDLTFPSKIPTFTPVIDITNQSSNNSPSPSKSPTFAPFTDQGIDFPSGTPIGFPTWAPSKISNLSTTAPASVLVTKTPTNPKTSSLFLEDFLNPHTCTNETNREDDNMQSTIYILKIKFLYSIEIAKSAVVGTVVGEIEEVLQEELAPLVLSCLNPNVINASIVTLDSLFLDKPSEEKECSPSLDTNNVCEIIQGSMRFVLSNKTAGHAALTLAGSEMANLFNSIAFAEEVGSGLLRTHFLGVITLAPELIAVGGPSIEGDENTTSILDEDDPNGEVANDLSGRDENTTSILDDDSPSQGDESNQSTGVYPREPGTSGSVAIASAQQNLTRTTYIGVASAALIVFTASIYFWKRSYTRHFSSEATSDASCRAPTNSPLSEMILISNQINANQSLPSGQGMSAILEDDEATVNSQTSSAIFMSEAGYSEQAGDEADTSLMSVDYPRSLYNRGSDSPSRLGARKRNQYLLDMAIDSGDDTSLSDIETSSVSDDVASDSSFVHHALPNDTSSPITTTLPRSAAHTLVTPRVTLRTRLVDTSADDSMQADDLLLFI